METITIVFVGLIAHVLTSGHVQRAVFVNAPLHDARIVVRAADVLEATSLAEEKSPNADERVFSINDRHLMFDGVAPTIASESFARYVPSLSAISNASALRDEVEAGLLFEGAHAYVDLRGGTLSAGDTITEAVFRGGRTSTTQCVAREVKYTIPTTSGSIVIRGTNGERLRLRAGATARVINDPPPTYTTPHYHMYAMILKDAGIVATPRSTGRACKSVEPSRGDRFARTTNAMTMVPAVLDVECVNSQFP